MVLLAKEKLHISAYSGHLQSQVPPNPTPTQPETSTPSYLQIH